MNYTSIEQSKKLLESGLNPDTADMYYKQRISAKTDMPYYDIFVGHSFAVEQKLFSFRNGLEFPCWSVGALLKVMPQTNKFHTKVDIEFNRVVFEPCDDEIVQAEDTFHYSDGKTLIEALVNMIVWLIENNYIGKFNTINK